MPPRAGNADSAAAAAAMLTGSDREAADRIVAAVRNPAATLAKADTVARRAARARRDRVRPRALRAPRQRVGGNAVGETRRAFQMGRRAEESRAQRARACIARRAIRPTRSRASRRCRPKPKTTRAANGTCASRSPPATGRKRSPRSTIFPRTQKADSRWRYLRARVLTKLDRKSRSRRRSSPTSRAKRASTASSPPTGSTSRTRSARARSRPIPPSKKPSRAQADLARAFEFQTLGMLPEARREWDFAMRKLDDPAKRLAADLAYRRGWYDRAVFFYSADPETQRLYEQRFPLALETQRQARSAATPASIRPGPTRSSAPKARG